MTEPITTEKIREIVSELEKKSCDHIVLDPVRLGEFLSNFEDGDKLMTREDFFNEDM